MVFVEITYVTHCKVCETIQSNLAEMRRTQKYFYLAAERSLYRDRNTYMQSLKLYIEIVPNLFLNKRVKWIGNNWRSFFYIFIQTLSLFIL